MTYTYALTNSGATIYNPHGQPVEHVPSETIAQQRVAALNMFELASA